MKRLGLLFLTMVLVLGILPIVCYAVDAEEAIFGRYTTGGYENRYFYFAVSLPAQFQSVSRSANMRDDEDVVEASNKFSTLAELYNHFQQGAVTVYTAVSEDSYLSIEVHAPAKNTDFFESEKTIAENSEAIIRKSLEDLASEGEEIENISTKVWYYTDFLGGKHYSVQYSCTVSGIPFYGANVYVRSKDTKYLAVFDLSSYNPDGVDQMCTFCSKL